MTDDLAEKLDPLVSMEEKLDAILNEMKTRFGRIPTEELKQRLCRVVTGGNGVDTGNHDYGVDPFYRSLIQGLREENFIKEIKNVAENMVYDVASVKGLMFEGFVNRKARMEREKEAMNQVQQEQRELALEQVKLSRRLTRMNTQMVVLTVVIAFGAVVVAWADLLEIWEYYYSQSYFRL